MIDDKCSLDNIHGDEEFVECLCKIEPCECLDMAWLYHNEVFFDDNTEE